MALTWSNKRPVCIRIQCLLRFHGENILKIFSLSSIRRMTTELSWGKHWPHQWIVFLWTVAVAFIISIFKIIYFSFLQSLFFSFFIFTFTSCFHLLVRRLLFPLYIFGTHSHAFYTPRYPDSMDTFYKCFKNFFPAVALGFAPAWHMAKFTVAMTARKTKANWISAFLLQYYWILNVLLACACHENMLFHPLYQIMHNNVQCFCIVHFIDLYCLFILPFSVLAKRPHTEQ